METKEVQKDQLDNQLRVMEYNGRPVAEYIFENFFTNQRILAEITETKTMLAKLDETKASKAEVTSIETRMTATDKWIQKIEENFEGYKKENEKRFDKLENTDTRILAIGTVLSAIISLVIPFFRS